MRSFKTSKRFSYKNLIYKSLIFIATVSVIVYFLPNEGKFNYQFDINKPWKYGLLQASFDFPIYKNDIQVQKEQDSILADYQPYFQIEKRSASTKGTGQHPGRLSTLFPNRQGSRKKCPFQIKGGLQQDLTPFTAGHGLCALY